MSGALLYLGVLMVTFLLGIPVALGLGGTSIILTLLERGVEGFSASFLAQRATYGLNNFLLVAVPLFLYCGKVMNTGTITEKIFTFAESLVGWTRGGLGHVNVVASVIFAGMTGTATSDAAGLGAVELAAMKGDGYSDDFSVAVTGASSTLGPIIPPSLPLVIFGMMTATSIGGLLVAGIIPGALMAIAMMAYVEYYAIRSGMKRRGKFSIRRVLHEGKRSFFALMTPAIIIGGILFGIFTPTEAAAVAAVYATIVTFVGKDITWKEYVQVLKDTVEDSGIILLIVGMAQVFGYMVTKSNIATNLAASLLTLSTNPIVMGLLIIVFLLIVGCFLEATAAITILASTLLPVAISVGIDPMQFGVIMVLTMMIGLLTPPFGMVLFILQRLSGLSTNRIAKATIPFLIPLLAVDVLLLLIPGLTTWLPRLM